MVIQLFTSTWRHFTRLNLGGKAEKEEKKDSPLQIYYGNQSDDGDGDEEVDDVAVHLHLHLQELNYYYYYY